MRGFTSGKWIEFGTSNKDKNSFLGDATRLWNQTPVEIKTTRTKMTAKRAIKKYCMTLQV